MFGEILRIFVLLQHRTQAYNKMILIADSGSTKTTWCVVFSDAVSFTVHTLGINPVRDGEDAIRVVFHNAKKAIDAERIQGRASSFADDSIEHLFFYGAGCIPPYSVALQRVLEQTFPGSDVSVNSDMLGAARALCGLKEGIACILGTGSNSCLYDGNTIVRNVSPLGWILGDEGSGAVLGRTLVGDLLKGQLPTALCNEFMQRYQLTQSDIIEAVYRKPLANRFLASFVPFLAEHRDEEGIHALLVDAFRRFFRRNVSAYQRWDLPVNFVGSVAYYFEKELTIAAEEEYFKIGLILREPMDKLVIYHRF